MFLPQIKQGGNYHIKKIVHYSSKIIEYGKKKYIPGYFELTLECIENKNSLINITLFEKELGEFKEFIK